MIAVGHCPISDGLQFFKPANGKLVSSIDYTLLSYSTSGALFGYQYQPGLFIYRLDEPTYIFKQKLYLDADSQWFFCQGHSQDLSQGFILHDLSSNFQVLLDTGPLYRGHVKF